MIHAIKCPTCEGKGSVPLPPHLQETMSAVEKVLKKHTDGATAPLVHSELNAETTVSAINLRLEDLVSKGKLKRLEGRHRVHYFPVELNLKSKPKST